MKIFDVVILTDDRYVDDSKQDQYSKNVYLEDSIVKKELEAIGLKVVKKSWADKSFDWSTAQYLLFRTTWDYFDRFNEFSTWLNEVSKVSSLLNSEKIIRWNLDKHYFQYLQQKGVPVCQTFFVEKGNQKSLLELATTYKLTDFVLKPCISGAARETYKISTNTIEKHEAIFHQLTNQEAMMLQPFQNNIVSKGEVSLILINGKFTHAVLKIAKEGDFRVQDDFGGSVYEYQPTKSEIAFAENAVNSCPEMPIYARVDVFLDNNNKLALAELELIEPELWFRNHPKAATLLAQAINQKINRHEKAV